MHDTCRSCTFGNKDLPSVGWSEKLWPSSAYGYQAAEAGLRTSQKPGPSIFGSPKQTFCCESPEADLQPVQQLGTHPGDGLAAKGLLLTAENRRAVVAQGGFSVACVLYLYMHTRHFETSYR